MRFRTDFNIVINIVENTLAMMKLNTLSVIPNGGSALGHSGNVVLIKCVVPLVLYRVLSTITPMFASLRSPFFTMITFTKIMDQNRNRANKVSMEILDFKVINKYWFSKFFKFKVSNFNLITISSNKSVTNFKITGSYPTLFLNIERVICGSVDSFTVVSRNVQDFICFLNPNVQNLF